MKVGQYLHLTDINNGQQYIERISKIEGDLITTNTCEIIENNKIIKFDGNNKFTYKKEKNKLKNLRYNNQEVFTYKTLTKAQYTALKI